MSIKAIMLNKKALPILLAALFFALPATASEVSIHDGDTFRLNGQKIRLWGIDAPELKQKCQGPNGKYACGEEAREALRLLIGSKQVDCRPVDTDRYERTVAICIAGGVELNAAMVRIGWALDYARYSKRHYAGEQEIAALEHLGMWRGCFERPWEWRNSQK